MLDYYSSTTEKTLKHKVKHIIDNSISLLERKISNIYTELNSLKTEYMDEIQKSKDRLI
jgi:hypothetical protein